MAWSYNAAEPTTRDKLRGLIGDTKQAEQQLVDETLDAVLTGQPNVRLAAAEACERIAARFAREESQAVAGGSISFANQTKKYLDLAALFRRRGRRRDEVPTTGGLSLAEARTAAADTDLPRRLFDVGMHDNPQTPRPEDLRES